MEYSKPLKTISKIIPTSGKHWVGDGFNVRPLFDNYAFTEALSPFLMFDYAEPKMFPPTKKRLGVGQHPHRGFSTVTIAFQGEVEHADSTGNTGVIAPGDVQWMDAGRGIVHQEFHSTKFAAEGGMFEMCQIWTNLPKKDKMIKPKYQPITTANIPKIYFNTKSNVCNVNDNNNANDTSNNNDAIGFVRIIAGEYKNNKGPAHTHSPIGMYDIEITKENQVFQYDIPTGWTTIVFNRGTKPLIIGDTSNDNNNTKKTTTIGPQAVAIMDTSNPTLRILGTEPNAKILLLTGEPLNEPIAHMGPFCMNTQQELQQAIHDYQNGKMGR